MKYVNLGKPDLKVSRICMGCMDFGNSATGQHCDKIHTSHTESAVNKYIANYFNKKFAKQWNRWAWTMRSCRCTK